MSQPAFSRSIAAFEQTCGLRIFDRHGGSVELTSRRLDYRTGPSCRCMSNATTSRCSSY
ncbi:LysR family transcriptional regulator [Paraburkholderia aromaticivorans]|uniref:LysR family transcriptional regulator n=1 Tax=Paraburkholderia aromaticivorans TaxID=2026199 RepID=UPI001456164B